MDKKIIITIGRQFGAGGLGVAIALGKKLGIPVYDKEILKKAAQDSGFSAEFFEESDEKKRFFSLASIFSNGFGDTENYMSDRGIFKMQSQTIKAIAEQGSAIIVGRCSDYILRDMESTLDVFLTSPAEVRTARVAERSGKTLEESARLVEEMDRKRAEYYNYYTFGDWGVAGTYDLCIDSSVLDIDGTADFIIDFARKAGLI